MAFRKIYSGKYLQPAIHILLWALIVTSPYLFRNPTTWSGFSSWHYKLMINNLFLAGCFYFNAYFLYPVLYKQRGLFVYILSLIILITLAMYLSHFIDGLLSLLKPVEAAHFHAGHHRYITVGRNGFRPDRHGWSRGWFGWYFTNIITNLCIIGISISYRIISDNSRQEKVRKEKENETLKTELSFLRSQVSPHFIFNVLNSMASMARKKSEMLEPSIIELSNLMRYMLYENDDEKVSLSSEVEYLEGYIALQKLRFGDDVTIVFVSPEYVIAYYIEPMLLVPFVENAFKHGLGLLKEPRIEIVLKVENDSGWLNFRVSNTIASQDDTKDKNPGIGLNNVKRRLELLYAGNHSLEIINDGQIFMTELKIKLIDDALPVS